MIFWHLMSRIREWTFVGSCLVPKVARQRNMIGAGRYTYWK
jgi:hypothetical protein